MGHKQIINIGKLTLLVIVFLHSYELVIAIETGQVESTSNGSIKTANVSIGTAWWLYLLYVALIVFNAFLSVTQVAVLCNDLRTLNLKSRSGSKKDQLQARGRWLTWLASRSGVFYFTTVFTSWLVGQGTSFIFGTFSDSWLISSAISLFMVIFVQVLAQLCGTRYSLWLGYYLAPLGVALYCSPIWLIAKPVSSLADYIFGTGFANFYRARDLRAIVEVHAQTSTSGGRVGKRKKKHKPSAYDGRLRAYQANFLLNAADCVDSPVSSFMRNSDDVVMLSITDSLRNATRRTMQEVLRSKICHIPIYDGSRNNIISILCITDFFLHDWSKSIKLERAMSANLYDAFSSPIRVDASSLLCTAFQNTSTEVVFVTTTSPNDEDQVVGVIFRNDIVDLLFTK